MALLIVGVVAGVVGVATYSAFSSTTANPSDSFAAGTVHLTDNDSGTRMLSLLLAKPNDSATACINVSYDGTLDSNVRLYASALAGTIGPYVTLTVTRGTDSAPSFSSCTNFSADSTNYIGAGAGVIYSSTLSSFPTSYASGIVDPTSGSPETWSTSENHSYKFTATLVNDNNAQGTSGSADFTWEARNL